MELFYSSEIDNGYLCLDETESAHCVRVLRHRRGDEISVIDGCGTLFVCELTDDNPKGAQARILEEKKGWGSHPYHLTLAVCPTKNIDRYEWFAEKATEFGLDCLAPVIGDHSERKIVKTERLSKILLSATKQSLKASVPQILEPESVKEFILGTSDDSLKLIAYCDESLGYRVSITDAIQSSGKKDIAVLIGPEGDFSPAEVDLAFKHGFIPVHLGTSRLRTETAALCAAAAVYFTCI